MPASAAGIAVVFTAAVHVAASPAPAVPAVGAVMYPDDDDGDDHNDPERLVIGEKSAAVAGIAVAGIAVAVVVAVHGRVSLLNRFLTPYYSLGGKV